MGNKRLEHIAFLLNRIVNPLSKIMNAIGSIVLLGMMILTTADVTLRYLFNRPIMGTYELVQLMLVIVVAFGFAYTAMQKGHIVVDVIFDLLPKKTRAILACAASLVSLGFFIVLIVAIISLVMRQIGDNALSGVLELHVYPVTIATAFAIAVLCLAVLAEFLERLIKGGEI